MIRLFLNWLEWINWDRSDHQCCNEVNGKTLFLTVDGKKFANKWNENKRHLDIHFALHTQRHDNPLPRCSMLVCMCSRRLCGIYVVRIPSRSVSLFYANIECEGERGFFTGMLHVGLRECLLRFFSINSPLEHGHALHCGMNARQICVPMQHLSLIHIWRCRRRG